MPAMMILHQSGVPAVVLAVEDEMLPRLRTVDMVEDAGFTPVEAVDADEAVAILDPDPTSRYCSPTSRCPAASTVLGSRMRCTSAGCESRSS
jgi:hypothetical protein